MDNNEKKNTEGKVYEDMWRMPDGTRGTLQDLLEWDRD